MTRENWDIVLEKVKKTKPMNRSLGLSLEAPETEADTPVFANEHPRQFLKWLLDMDGSART